MQNLQSLIFAPCSLLVSLCSAQIAEPSNNVQNVLNQRIPELNLQEETVFDAVARLNEELPVAFAIEGLIASPKPSNPKFSIKFEGGTLREALDQLFALDTRYVWVVDGQTINILPRIALLDDSYILNTRLEQIVIRDAKDAFDALDQLLQQASTRESIAILQTGSSFNFSKPITFTLKSCTLRQAINRITEKLGPTQGWQLAGTKNFKSMVLHTRLASRRKPLQPGIEYK